MKILILVRHANALGSFTSKADTDAARPLSDMGIDEARQTAVELAQMGYKPEVILTSPLLRAVQTADILAQKLGVPYTEDKKLSGMYSDREVCQLLSGQMKKHDTVIAVGHNPNIAMVAQLFVKQIKAFAPGSFMVLNFDNPHRPELVRFAE